MNAVVKSDPSPLTPNSLDEAIRVAEFMARAKLVPQHLQGDVGSCLMIVEQAMRWRMSPFAVAQCASSIKGKLMYEGKLVAAVVETSGAIVGHLDYVFSGQGDDRTVTVSGLRRGDTEIRTMDVRLGAVKTENEMWKKQPDQQLVYSGARNWARRWTPAVMLGVYVPEEIDREPAQEPFTGTTIEGKSEHPMAPEELRRAAESGAFSDMQPPKPGSMREFVAQEGLDKRAQVYETAPADHHEGTGVWLENLRVKLAACKTPDDVHQIAKLKSVSGALVNAPEAIKREVNAMLADAYAEIDKASEEGADAGPEIEGEKYASA